MTSTLPSLSRSLNSWGVFGLLVKNGSITITLPLGVVIFVVACPSQWTSVLPVCAHDGSTTSVSVAATPNFRKSRRSIWPPLPPLYRRSREGTMSDEEVRHREADVRERE